tara:strand:- start:3350 stop:3667 length:318 start_codon:yes stop_codon:yes gene_type:complete
MQQQPEKFRFFFFNYDELSSLDLQCLLDELQMYTMNDLVSWKDTMESLFGDLEGMEEEEIPEEKYVARYVVELEEAIVLAEEHEREYQAEIDMINDLHSEYWRSQ